MAEGLDAWQHLDAEGVGVVVELTQFVVGVWPAQVAEEWLVGHAVGVFGVEHDGVDAHQRRAAKKCLDGVDGENSVARAFEHELHAVESARLGEGARLTVGRGCAEQPADGAKGLDRAAVGDVDAVAVRRDFEGPALGASVVLDEAARDARVAPPPPKDGAQRGLRHSCPRTSRCVVSAIGCTRQ